MVSQPPPTEADSIFESLEASSRVAELEAQVAQLKEALARRQQIGVATGLLAQRFAITPERSWSLLVRLSQNSHVKVRDIAEAIINAHCGRISPIDAEIISGIESYLPDGVCLIAARGSGEQLLSSDAQSVIGLDTSGAGRQ
jgi:ANTAR domain